MSDELSEGALRNISFMRRMMKTIPDDFIMIAAVQELAQVVHDLKPFLTPAQEATLLGMGTLLMRAGKDEAIAGIQAAIALQNARGP